MPEDGKEINVDVLPLRQGDEGSTRISSRAEKSGFAPHEPLP